MNEEFSFRRFACLYLNAYCSSHEQRHPMNDEQISAARALFHTFLSALDAPVPVSADPLHEVAPEHPVRDLKILKLFVAHFARDFLGYGDRIPRRR